MNFTEYAQKHGSYSFKGNITIIGNKEVHATVVRYHLSKGGELFLVSATGNQERYGPVTHTKIDEVKDPELLKSLEDELEKACIEKCKLPPEPVLVEKKKLTDLLDIKTVPNNLKGVRI